MSLPITYSSGAPNFAYNGATVVIPPQAGGYGVLELEARPTRNLYVAAFVLVHGPDCQLSRVFPFDASLSSGYGFIRAATSAPTIIDANLVTFPTNDVASFGGVFLTTGLLRYGTTVLAPPPQEASFTVPSRQIKAPVSEVTIREFQMESFPVPLYVPPGSTGIIRCIESDQEVRVGIRWFEQARGNQGAG